MAADLIGFGYAALITVGGLAGYAKAGSIMSLISGIVCGGLLGLGAYHTSENPKNVYLALGTATFLTGMMGFRFLKSGKFMPAGMVTAVSLIMVVRLGYRLVQ